MKKILFISDVYTDQIISGVTIWLVNMKKALEELGYEVKILHPGLFSFNIPLFTDPQIKLSFFARRRMAKIMKEFQPDFVHITTEGPLGFTALLCCQKFSWKFSTFYHSRLPEYIQMRVKALKTTTYKYLSWFHSFSDCTMVPTPSLREELGARGFKNLALVPNGIDLGFFKKNSKARLPADLQKPLFIYFGRVAHEKRVQDFLKCDLPGSKLVVGDGNMRAALELEFGSQALFVGRKTGQDLVDLISVADVFVFPSETDTFGLTILEALACGVPVAAYNVTGPKDIIEDGKQGFLGPDLSENAKKCLELKSEDCIKKAHEYSWGRSAQAFLKVLVSIDGTFHFKELPEKTESFLSTPKIRSASL